MSPMRRRISMWAAGTACALLAACKATRPTEVVPFTVSQGPHVAYLAAYFTGTDERHLYYALSTDGTHFDERVNEGRPVLAAHFDDRLIRDPMILQDRTGVYHLVATVSWTHDAFTLWDSADLVTWVNERMIVTGLAGAAQVWAPELAYDPEHNQYFVFWTSSIGTWESASIYYATTKDFKSFSAPALLFSRDGPVMDATLTYDGLRWHLFYRTDFIRQSTAAHALGPYGNEALVTLDNGEGPFVFARNDGAGWELLWDYYNGNQGFGLMSTTDLTHWSRLTNAAAPYYNAAVSFPADVRHGSVIPVTQAEVDLLRRLRVTPK